MQSDVPVWVWILFPIAFGAFWLAITGLLGLMSGWFGLQDRFPDKDEPAIAMWRRQSGRMGLGVGFQNILRLSATRTGLRVALPRFFSPFQRPFLVPWNKIGVEPTNILFFRAVRLRFGDPEQGRLVIAARTWACIAEHADATPRRRR